MLFSPNDDDNSSNNNELQRAEEFVEAECNSDGQETPLLS
jgi:hypothetical protein